MILDSRTNHFAMIVSCKITTWRQLSQDFVAYPVIVRNGFDHIMCLLNDVLDRQKRMQEHFDKYN